MGRNYESSFPTDSTGIDRTTNILLEATSIKSPVQTNVKYQQVYEENWLIPSEMGSCTGEFVEGKYIITSRLSPRIRSMDSVKEIFTKGHEEGHALDFLGNLSGLCFEALLNGYKFDVLPFDYAAKSDEARKKFISMQSDDMDSIYLNKDHRTKELIANIGGLIALIKNEENPLAIEMLAKSINARNLMLTELFIYSTDWNPKEVSSPSISIF